MRAFLATSVKPCSNTPTGGDGKYEPTLASPRGRGIARVIGWSLTTAILALEAFVTGPRLDQRAVDREVLSREQAAAEGLCQHLGKEGVGHFGGQQPFAAL